MLELADVTLSMPNALYDEVTEGGCERANSSKHYPPLPLLHSTFNCLPPSCKKLMSLEHHYNRFKLKRGGEITFVQPAASPAAVINRGEGKWWKKGRSCSLHTSATEKSNVHKYVVYSVLSTPD